MDGLSMVKGLRNVDKSELMRNCWQILEQSELKLFINNNAMSSSSQDIPFSGGKEKK